MGVLAGPIAVARAVQLLWTRRRIIPPIISIVLLLMAVTTLIAWGLLISLPGLFRWLWPDPATGIGHWLWTTSYGMIVATSALFSFFLMPWLVMLIGIPLCDPLVGRVETVLEGELPQSTLLGDFTRAVTTTLGIISIGISGTLLFFALGLIPGVSTWTTPFVLFIWTPFFLALDLCDGSLARRNMGLVDKLRWALRHPIPVLSLGLTSALLVAIPGLNLLGLPIAVVAGVFVVRLSEKIERS